MEWLLMNNQFYYDWENRTMRCDLCDEIKSDCKCDPTFREIIHGPQCWPPTKCIDPDNCPFVCAVITQKAEDLVI